MTPRDKNQSRNLVGLFVRREVYFPLFFSLALTYLHFHVCACLACLLACLEGASSSASPTKQASKHKTIIVSACRRPFRAVCFCLVINQSVNNKFNQLSLNLNQHINFWRKRGTGRFVIMGAGTGGSEDIQYSEKYYDAFYEYRHVILPSDITKLVPRTHLLTESEWRNLGVQQSPGWVNYMMHTPEPHILLFRRRREEESL